MVKTSDASNSARDAFDAYEYMDDAEFARRTAQHHFFLESDAFREGGGSGTALNDALARVAATNALAADDLKEEVIVVRDMIEGRFAAGGSNVTSADVTTIARMAAHLGIPPNATVPEFRARSQGPVEKALLQIDQAEIDYRRGIITAAEYVERFERAEAAIPASERGVLHAWSERLRDDIERGVAANRADTLPGDVADAARIGVAEFVAEAGRNRKDVRFDRRGDA